MIFCVWSLYTSLEFQFHAVKLGLEVEVCFDFFLLVFSMSFFLVARIGPLHHDVMESALKYLLCCCIWFVYMPF